MDNALAEYFRHDVSLMSKDEIRELISRAESILKDCEQIDIPTEHHFAKAVYGRKITIPKGALIIGKIHKHENLCIIAKGKVSVVSIDGVQHLEAGDTFVASPGAKRVIFAHEDSVWVNAHGTELRDVDKIEEEFIAKSYDELPVVIEVKETKCLG